MSVVAVGAAAGAAHLDSRQESVQEPATSTSVPDAALPAAAGNVTRRSPHKNLYAALCAPCPYHSYPCVQVSTIIHPSTGTPNGSCSMQSRESVIPSLEAGWKQLYTQAWRGRGHIWIPGARRSRLQRRDRGRASLVTWGLPGARIPAAAEGERTRRAVVVALLPTNPAQVLHRCLCGPGISRPGEGRDSTTKCCFTSLEFRREQHYSSVKVRRTCPRPHVRRTFTPCLTSRTATRRRCRRPR